MTDKKGFTIQGGFVSVRQEYGYIPFLLDPQMPAYNIVGESRVDFSVYELPLSLNIFQSGKKYSNGMGNYFTISFNAEEYRNIGEKKIAEQQKILKNKADSLQHISSGLAKRINYLEVVKRMKLNKPDVQVPDSINTNKPQIPDSLQSYSDMQVPELQLNDTIAHSLTHVKDSVPTSYVDSLSLDEITALHDELLNKYNNINTEVDQLKRQVAVYDTIRNTRSMADVKYRKGIGAFLNTVEKFEIGLSTPTYSEWLVNCPVKGVNLQTGNSSSFIAFTYGTVVDYNYYNRTISLSRLKSMESDFNDFIHVNSAGNGRKILSGEIGYGDKEASYVALGMLKGKGRQSYYSFFEEAPQPQGSDDRNYVVEISGQVKLKSHKIKASAAQSTIISAYEDIKPVDALTTSDNSNAYSLSHSVNSSKLKAIWQTDAEWVDPFFKSYGLSYKKADRFRFRSKVSKQIKSLKLSLFYRYETDNIKDLYDYKNTSNSAGVSTTWRINKNISLKGSFSPVVIRNHSEEGSTIFKNLNYSAGLNFKKKLGKGNLTSDANYSLVYSFDSTAIFSYQVIGLNNSIFIGDKTIFLNANSFVQESELRNDNYYVGEVGTTFQMGKRWSFSIAAKCMFTSPGFEPGYRGEAGVTLTKNLHLTVGMEKMLMGEFVNEEINKPSNTNFYKCELKYTFNTKK